MTDTHVLPRQGFSPPPPRPPRRPPGGARRHRVGELLRDTLLTLPPALATLAVSLIGLSERALWNDEYATWYAATLSFGDLLKLLDNVDAVLAPYYVAMHGWIVLFGDSPTSLRMPSVLAMSVAAGLIVLVGRRLFNTGVGFAAGLLFAGLPAVSRYSQEARPYAFAIAAVTLATLLLLRALDVPTWRRWAGYGACLILVGLIHIVALTVLFAHAVTVWRVLRANDDFRMLRWTAAVLAAVTVALPLAAKGSEESNAIAWIKADGQAVRQLPEKVFGSSPVAVLLLATALASVVLLLWLRDRGPGLLLLCWAVFPPLFCYLTFPLLHLFLHRYLLFTVPAWVLLAAALSFAAARLVLGGRQPSSLASLSVLLVVAGIFYVSESGQQSVRRSPVAGEPDFRAAARAIAVRVRPGDGIAYSGLERNGRRAFAYELRGMTMPRDVFVARTSQELGTFGAEECKEPGTCLGDTDRVWLVAATTSSEDPFAGMSEPAKGLLQVGFSSTELPRFDHVRVLLFARLDAS